MSIALIIQYQQYLRPTMIESYDAN